MALKITTRSQWGARYRDGFGARPIGRLETWLHHSVTTHLKADATAAEERAEVRKIESIGQTRFNGGISYTFLVFPSGRVYAGTNIDRIGAHTKGHNTAGAGICIVGNYQNTAPTAAQEKAIADLLKHGVAQGWWAKTKLNGGHRDVAATACPGNKAYPRIPNINALAAKGASSSAAKPAPAKNPVLAYGSRGAAVGRLQRFLANVGMNPGPIDNIFGAKTQAAVRRYQQAVRIVVDGIVGAETWGKINAGVKPKQGATPLLKRGKRGAAVGKLQRGLNRAFPSYSRLAVDDIYGAKTDAVVREFQRRAKAAGKYRGAIDGIVGPLTWAALAAYGIRP